MVNNFFNSSGFVAERMNLRYFLSLGMILSGVFTFLFGFAKTINVHSIYYFIAIQVSRTFTCSDIFWRSSCLERWSLAAKLFLTFTFQILAGAFSSSGWPGVVTAVANWFGKSKKGLIFGIWNAHTSVGNILGSVVAGIVIH